MASKQPVGYTMRVIHRYLGFFLAGIMAVYALSGITLIYRNTNTFKKAKQVDKTIDSGLSAEQLGQTLRIRNLKVEEEKEGLFYFEDGTYNSNTGEVSYVERRIPYVLDKMQHLHKAKKGDRFYFLNIFFGISLFFFVISAFWMFLPKSKTFKKGMYFTLAGIVLMLILLFA